MSLPSPTVLDVQSLQYTRRVNTAIPFIVISSIFSTVLLPILGMLFILSTPQSRRTPIFVLNVLAISLGVVVGVLCNHLSIKNIMSPTSGVSATEDFLFSIIYVWMPWITEAILLLRVIVVFRSACVPVLHMFLLLVFPILFKVTRAVINILFLLKLKAVTVDTGSNTLNQFSATVSVGKGLIKMGWILELIDNGYISALFLWRLAMQAHAFDDIQVTSIYSNHSSPENSFTNKLQTLFWIASTNFVFPTIFGLVQVIVLTIDKCIFVATYLDMVNLYISVISTVFATIWAATNSIHHNSLSEREESNLQHVEPITFRVPQDLSVIVDVAGEHSTSAKLEDLTTKRVDNSAPR